MNCDGMIIDIETETFNNEINANVDRFVVAGMYSLKTKKYKITTNKIVIQNWINDHRVIINHNLKGYDIPILERVGIDFKYKKLIDTLEISKKRTKTLLGIDSGNGLRNLAKAFKFPILKGDIDYDVFKKKVENWSGEEKKEIIKYLKGDLDVTRLLFEKFYEEFLEFKQFVSEKNQKNWSWLTCSSGSLGYKVMCNFVDIPEVYGKMTREKEEGGGLVLLPTDEECENVWYLDFSSLYPWISSLFNIFANPTLCPDGKKWFTGNNVFKVKGKYCIDERHILSKKTVEMYKNRKAIKKSNPKRAQAYKIILNSEYGVLRSPMFESTYYKHSGFDICCIGQQFNRIIKEFFDEAGFRSIYGDTDSRFLKYVKGDMTMDEEFKLLNKTKDKLIKYIMDNVPFPEDGFDLESETGDKPIKYIKFVKKENSEEYAKKNYLYLTHDNKVKITGLPLIKKGSTKVSMLVYKKHLKDMIIERGNSNFSTVYLMNLIKSELKKDLCLASMEYNVKKYDFYKNKRLLRAKISKEFFDGKFGKIRLIKNNYYGKVRDEAGWFYCTEDEVEKIDIKNLCLTKIITELKPFIKKEKEKSIFDY